MKTVVGGYQRHVVYGDKWQCSIAAAGSARKVTRNAKHPPLRKNNGTATVDMYRVQSCVVVSASGKKKTSFVSVAYRTASD